MTALEMQWELYDRARKYAELDGLDAVGGERGRPTRCSTGGSTVLTGLETDPMALADQLDWVAKKRLLDAYRERHGLDWDDARLAGHRPPVPRPASRQVACSPRLGVER